MSLSVAVVTSTQGRSTITKAIQSVKDQTRKATHYVFIHGSEYSDKTIPHLADDTVAVHLPRANGGGGYGMAPVFALAPFAITEDIIFYLDDDNWYEPDHIESLVEMIEKHDLGWAYSLRKIVDNEGNFICEDNCESLGCIPNSHQQYLVDNSCYAVRTDVARRHSHAWYVPIVSDRSFQSELMRAKIRCGTTGKHSVNYRLSQDGTGGMTKEKFINNNGWMLLNRPDCSWTKKHIFNF
jgi:glycosyltransferase involved in cell wall biosynthesis